MLKCIINKLVLTAQLHSTAGTHVAPPGTRIVCNGCSARLHHHRQLSSCLMFSESPHGPSAAPTPGLDQGRHRLPTQDLPQGFSGDMWCQASGACVNHFHTASGIKTDSGSPTLCPGHSPDFSAAAKVPSTSTPDVRDCA